MAAIAERLVSNPKRYPLALQLEERGILCTWKIYNTEANLAYLTHRESVRAVDAGQVVGVVKASG